MGRNLTTIYQATTLKFTNPPSLPLQQQPTTPSSMSTSDMSSLDDLDNLTDLLQMPSSQELTNFVTWDMDMADIKQESTDRNTVTSTTCDQVTSADNNGNNCLDVSIGGNNCNGFEFGDINLDFVDNSLAGLIS